MSVWVSVGPKIRAETYLDSGHRPSNRDGFDRWLDLAYVPPHLTTGTWVRLGVGTDIRLVLGKRAVRELRDTLTTILDLDTLPPVPRRDEMSKPRLLGSVLRCRRCCDGLPPGRVRGGRRGHQATAALPV